MRIDVLDETTLARVGYLDSWLSLLWVDAYNTAGSLTLEVTPTDENLSLLTVGRWLKRSDSDLPMRICSRSNQNTDHNLVCTGYPATWILTKRVSTAIVSNQSAELAMRQLVADMAPWPRLALGTLVGFEDVYSNQTSGGSIFEYCSTIGAALDMGFRIRLAGSNADKQLLFEVYRPTRDPNLKYSEAFGNLLEAVYQFADGDYANVAIVQGAGEGDARVTVTVGETDLTGAERRELYVDARDVQPDEDAGETTASAGYLARLMSRGANKLLEQIPIGAIEFAVDDEGLQLGDVVTAILPKLGYTAMARVVEITLQSQAGSTTRTVRVGTPLFTARGGAK